MKIPFGDFSLIGENGVALKRDEAFYIKDSSDLQRAIRLLENYYQSLGGDNNILLLELWTPASSDKKTTFSKDVFENVL
jgi:hypothetical protein